MKKTLLLATAILLAVCPGFAQIRNFWSPAASVSPDQTISNKKVAPSDFKLFALDVASLKKVLQTAPDRASRVRTEVMITFPTPDGGFQNFKIV